MPTLDELKAHKLFQQLTEKQQRFVQEFCTNDFKLVAAVHAAYTCKSDRSAYCFGRNLLRKWQIRTVLGFMGYSQEGAAMTRAEALYILTERLRDPKTPVVFMMALYRELALLARWKIPNYSGTGWQGKTHHPKTRRSPGPPPEQQEQPQEQPEPSIDDLILEIERQQKSAT